MDKQNKSNILSTKVTPEAAAKFQAAAMKMGLNSPYELLQVVIDCLIRYIDAPSEASEPLRRMMSMFDDFTYSTGKLRPLDAPKIGDESYIEKAIYFVRRKDKKRPYLVMVHKPIMGDGSADYNINHIFDDFVREAMPRQYQQLKGIARNIEVDSIIEAFFYILDSSEKTTEDEVIFHELFSDNERDVLGSQLAVYDKKYNTKQHRDIDAKEYGIHTRDKQRTMEKIASKETASEPSMRDMFDN